MAWVFLGMIWPAVGVPCLVHAVLEKQDRMISKVHGKHRAGIYDVNP